MADIINVSKSVSEESRNNVIISGLVPCIGYIKTEVRNVNTMLREYCRNFMLTFLKHDNINAKTHSSISDLHLNSKCITV